MTTYLVDHVAFRMPAFIPLVSVDLYKLLQDGIGASDTFCRKSRRVVKVTI